MKNKRIYLITRGDDGGSNQTANQAIMEACQKGILKNVSFMVPGQFFEEAAGMFAGHSQVCCGLHTTVTAEWDSVRWGPVLPSEQVPSLVDTKGHFFQTTQELRNNQPQLNEIMAEIQSQLDIARESGLDIRYADMHMAWGNGNEDWMEAFDQWCQEEELVNFNKWSNRLPKAAGSGDPIEQIIVKLEKTPPGVYALVGHPAYDNEEMRALGHVGYSGEQVGQERDWERRYFTDPRIIDYCQEHGVVPIRYDEAEQYS